jgi:hypothetical protein
MTYLEATNDVLSLGKAIRRRNSFWLENDVFIFEGRLQPILVSITTGNYLQSKSYKTITSCLFIKEASGMIIPYTPSQSDIYANDWEHVTFNEPNLVEQT